jgi:hypothetical protein
VLDEIPLMHEVLFNDLLQYVFLCRHGNTRKLLPLRALEAKAARIL